MRKIFILALFAIFAFGDTNTSFSMSNKEGTFIKVSSGQGSADTRDEAIKNAIVEAITKIKGFSTANSAQSIRNYKSTDLAGNAVDTKLTEQIHQATKGRVDSYELINIVENNGKYTASVNVFKILFTRNQKPNLTLINASRYKNLGDMLKQRLTNDFTKSKRFNVLDRANSAYYKAEKMLIESEDASSEDIFKLGNVLGTDYMLVFNIRDVGVSRSKASSITTNESTGVGADVAVDYRLIFFATREIKLSNTITIRLSLKDDSVKTNEEAMNKISQALSKDILNELYPLYVAAVTEKEVSFEEKLEVGENYECTSKNSTQTANIEITRSSANLSNAKILNGKVSIGDVCKLNLNKGKDATYKLGTKGGVILGF